MGRRMKRAALLFAVLAALPSPAMADGFAAHFADLAVPAEPVLPPHAVDLDSLPQRSEPAAASDPASDFGAGVASYYGAEFAGRRTASGERFDPRALTAAHRTLPFGTRVRVTNPANGRSVVVRINDRGPFIRGRTIDLSRGAAERIGLVGPGHGPVRLALLDR